MCRRVWQVPVGHWEFACEGEDVWLNSLLSWRLLVQINVYFAPQD